MDLSILIPTCNRVDATMECVNRLSVALAGSTLQCEVILGNDGPPEDIPRLTPARFPCPIRVSQGPRQGPAANRNHLAAQAVGDFVLFLDDDIKPAKDLIVAYEAAMRTHPEADILEGRIVSEARPRFVYDEVIENETGGYLWTANLAVRRKTFEQLHGFDTDFPFAAMEDTDFRYRAQAANAVIVWCPEAYVTHPIVARKGGLNSARHRYSLLLFVHKYPQYLDKMRSSFTYTQCLRLVKHNLVRRSLLQPMAGYANLFHRIRSVLITRRFLRDPAKIPAELARMQAELKIPPRPAK